MSRSSAASNSQRTLQWQERIAHQTKSGQSIAAYCRDHGIAVQTFYWWRAKLAKDNRKTSTPARPRRIAAPFIDLGALAQAEDARGMTEHVNIRLDLGNGMVLSIARR